MVGLMEDALSETRYHSPGGLASQACTQAGSGGNLSLGPHPGTWLSPRCIGQAMVPVKAGGNPLPATLTGRATATAKTIVTRKIHCKWSRHWVY